MARGYAFALAGALALGGCATIYDLENRAPDGRYVSRQPRDAVAQCVASGIASLGKVDTRRGDGATQIVLRTQNGYPAALITVRTTQGGSNVSVRQTINYSIGPIVRRCL